MNNNPKDILAAIASTLTASPSLVPNTLKQIKTGVDADHSGGFPYCRVYFVDFPERVADTISHERTYRFAIEVWQEITQKAKAAAESDFANAVHLVLNRLAAQWQLGIGLEGGSLSSGGVKPVEINGAPMRVATIYFDALTLIQNPS